MTAAIRTAILGFGVSGRIFHAPFLAANPDYEVSAIVTTNAQRREAAAREYPQARLFDSPDDVWAQSDAFDLAVIGTPNGTHEAFASQALSVGLGVVVDKPFATTSAGGRAVVQQAAEAGLVLTVFQNRRWDGDFLTVRRLIESETLGSVHRFESRFEWWQPSRDASWKTTSTRAEGGGILFDLGTHVIDQALQSFGPAREIYAEIDTRGGGAAEDDVFLAMEHDAGTRSGLWMSAAAPARAPRFHVQGSAAGYTSYGLDVQEPSLIAGARPLDDGFGETPEEHWGTLSAGSNSRRIPTERGDYGEFYRGLVPALRGEGDPPVDPEDAIAVLEVIERAFTFG